MSTALSLSAHDYALKQHYTAEMVENMVYKDNPFLALVAKMEEFGGRNLPIPVIYGNPQGRSATFARAQARGQLSSTKGLAFLLTRVKDYSVATMDNETIEASKGDANAFLEAATVEIDGAINSLTRSLAVAQYRQGYGEIGQIGSISTTTITLLNVEDVTNFEVGQELDVSATISGALRAYGTSGNGLIVTSINRDTGVLTFGANVTHADNGIPTAAANDYIFVRGDHTASSLTKLAGMEAWNPYTAPAAAESFFGVDRSVDVTRLSGLRYDGTADPIEEALVTAASRAAREGAKIDHFFMNFKKFGELEKALGAKVQYVNMQANAVVGFRGMIINGPKGPINVVPDQNCPADRIRGVDLSMWKHCSLGKAVRTIDTDGLQMLRQSSDDGVEVRIGHYGNLACKAPGSNINIKVTA